MGEYLFYRRVAGDLRRMIRVGEVVPGDLLPSERELEDIYGVSRNTVRRALAVLVDERLVRSHHGLGYVVMQRPSGAHECRHCGTTWDGDDGCAAAPGRA